MRVAASPGAEASPRHSAIVVAVVAAALRPESPARSGNAEARDSLAALEAIR